MKKVVFALGIAATLLSTVPAEAAGPFRFYALTPCRAIDTRNPNGPAGGPVMTSNVKRNFTMQGACGVPAGATAVAINVTIATPTNTGHLTLFPNGTVNPGVSTLNWVANVPALANGAIVPISVSTPDLSVLPFVTGGGTVHVIIDITGYFAPVV